MSLAGKTSKAAFILLAFSLTVSTAAAAEINPQDPIIWMDGENNQVEATFDGLEKDKEYTVKIDGTKVDSFKGSDKDAENLTTDEVIEALGSSASTGKSKISLGKNTEKTIYFRKLSASIEKDGSGFVNGRLGGHEETEKMEIDLELKGAPERFITAQRLNKFSATDGRLTEFMKQLKVERLDGVTAVRVKTGPKVTEPIQNEISVSFSYKLNESTVQKEIKTTPHIYELRAIPVGEKPSPLSDFKNIKRNFSYTLNMVRYGEDVGVGLGDSSIDSPLSNSADDHNFDLDINLVSKKGTDYENSDEQKLLSVDDLSGSSSGDYRIKLSQIPALKPGVYEFVTRLQYTDSNGEQETVFIDKIRVRKGLVLSGQVMDSGSRGIEMNMVLNEQGASNTIPVETDSSGYYSKEIPNPNSEYDATMRFFDTVSSSRSYSDGRITVKGIDFSSGNDQDFAGDQQAIKFQYWQDPPVKLKAINPINMMAVKFAYPIDSSGHTASMKFNPANVNTDELKVYRCSQWNFIGKSCLGDWNEISGDLTINYQAWRANFDIEDPYTAENARGGSQNILMNAYIVGTSADLSLNNGISVSGAGSDGRVETSGDVTVKGRVVSENDNFVSGAEVDVSFYEGSAEIKTFETVETDSEGRFSVTGEAPEDPGNYSVVVSADAANYDGFERRFDDSLETFIAEGVDLSVESPLDVTLGEKTSTTVEVQNTGQTEMQNVELSFSGVNSEFYSVSTFSLGTIPASESRNVELTFKFPASYCDDVCQSYPSMNVEVSAQNSEGDRFSDSESIQTQITQVSDSTSTASSESDSTDNSGNGSSFSTPDVAEATGEFLESQSSLNIALGLILVFLMVLGGALKKKKEEGNQRQRGRPEIKRSEMAQSRPDLTENEKNLEDEDEDTEVDEQIDEIADAFEEESSGEETGEKESREEDEEQKEVEEDENEQPEDGSESFKCSVCGEEFDSESGVELHEDVVH